MCSLGLAVIQVVVISAIAACIGFVGALTSDRFLDTLPVLTVVSFHNIALSYWIILSGMYGLAYYRRYQEREKQALLLELRASELETQLMRARLDALKMQLQPRPMTTVAYPTKISRSGLIRASSIPSIRRAIRGDSLSYSTCRIIHSRSSRSSRSTASTFDESTTIPVSNSGTHSSLNAEHAGNHLDVKIC